MELKICPEYDNVNIIPPIKVCYSQNELLKTLKTCNNKPLFKVLIVSDDNNEKRYYEEDILSMLRQESISYSAVIKHQEYQTIRFNNGSIIKLVSSGYDNLKGHRVNKILFSDKIKSKDIIDNIFFVLMIPYHNGGYL